MSIWTNICHNILNNTQTLHVCPKIYPVLMIPKHQLNKQCVCQKHNAPYCADLIFLFDLLPWRMTLTLTFHHSKCAAAWDTHACQISSCYDQYCKSYDHFFETLTQVWRNYRRTDRQTDGQTDSAITICHPTGGIKKAYSTAHKFNKKYIFTFRQFLFTSIAKK